MSEIRLQDSSEVYQHTDVRSLATLPVTSHSGVVTPRSSAPLWDPGGLDARGALPRGRSQWAQCGAERRGHSPCVGGRQQGPGQGSPGRSGATAGGGAACRHLPRGQREAELAGASHPPAPVGRLLPARDLSPAGSTRLEGLVARRARHRAHRLGVKPGLGAIPEEQPLRPGGDTARAAPHLPVAAAQRRGDLRSPPSPSATCRLVPVQPFQALLRAEVDWGKEVRLHPAPPKPFAQVWSHC